MNPVRATTVPKIEKGSEFRTINTLRIVDMKTHHLRGNRKPKNPIRKLMHLKACRKPTQAAWRRWPTESKFSLKIHLPKETTNQKDDGSPGRAGQTEEAKQSLRESSKTIPGRKSKSARSMLEESRRPVSRGAGGRRGPEPGNRRGERGGKPPPPPPDHRTGDAAAAPLRCSDREPMSLFSNTYPLAPNIWR
jgi:hypothetical protein